jgi:hypothetical protein
MNVRIPVNALSFYKIMIPIVMFDVLEGLNFIENIFGE